jgi:ribonuclease Y
MTGCASLKKEKEFTMDMTSVLIGTGVGFLLGLIVFFIIQKIKVKNAQSSAEAIIAEAQRSAQRIEKEANLKAKEYIQQERSQMQRQLKQKERDLAKSEENLRRREKELNRKDNILRERENSLKKQQNQLAQLQTRISERENEVAELVDKQLQKLEELSGINREEAKRELKLAMLDKAKSEVAKTLIEMRKEAEDRARWEAKEIMAHAIEKMATEYTMESTLVSVSLPNDSWKGLIIGREGRNIKAFEAATGVKVIVDDTPETVVMSSFDPVKREVARLAMEALIQKKNIHPKAIEQEVEKAQKQVDESIRQAAEETLKELNIKDVHPELKTYIGRLKYRTSYGQNILQHSKEVAWLAGNMAAELGLNVQLARRAGLLHDIGKAESSDSEGSHVTLGVEITKRFKEHPVVINAVLAHHEEAEPISPISVLVTAADRISGARPGARRESLEAYTERIQKLEELANSFEGVAKTYALSAGREIRVIVIPEKLTDQEADLLAHDIAEKIKENMEYPGQIKVTIIRHLVATSSTEEFLAAESNMGNGNGNNGNNRKNRNKNATHQNN